MPYYTIVLHTDGLYYVADEFDFVTPIGFKTLKEAEFELEQWECEAEEDEDEGR